MTDEQARRLGLVIAQARQKRALSLRALAAAADVSFTFVRRVEIGLHADPSVAKLARIVLALDLPPEQVNAVTGGRFFAGMPSLDVYLKTKGGLAPHDVRVVTQLVVAMQGTREGGDER